MNPDDLISFSINGTLVKATRQEWARIGRWIDDELVEGRPPEKNPPIRVYRINDEIALGPVSPFVMGLIEKITRERDEELR